ncbi:hypothetical protein ACIHFD_67640 [Nonomuraea sp. NPDC051941]|uniref:hypothetical protein n=1 Tax=Nonomuraea sp. NPDC051941 TaxID=3364373 RepID=UPI0037C6D777
MARHDYKILYWDGDMDGHWSHAAEERYEDNGYNGLVLTPGGSWTPEGLSFLRNLPELRYFSLEQQFKADVEAFEVDTLKELSLVTNSRRPIPHTIQPEMVSLCLTDRPGIALGNHWPQLKEFRLGNWRGADCLALSEGRQLTLTQLEGRRQDISMTGIQNCVNLRSLAMLNVAVHDCEAVAGLANLEEISLMAPTGKTHAPIDFSPFTSERLRKIWISGASELVNLSRLGEVESLRNIRLIRSNLTDEDRLALAAFPKRIKVEII